jgi:cell division protein FtsB
MAKKRKPAAAKLRRLEARVRVLQGAGNLVFFCLCASVGFVVVATAFPQKRELDRIEEQLARIREREREVLAEREYHEIENRALRTDLEYIETRARDRLGYYREGERVLKFPRGE